MHLLVLDDDVHVAKILTRVAAELGWTADYVTTPQAFQAECARSCPDLIVLDLRLGASDGIEQLRILRDANFARPVVLTSGFDERVLTAAEQLGASLGLNMAGVLRKPVRVSTARELLQFIEQKHAPISGERIAAALSRDEMRFELQPIIDAHTAQVHHLEALIRWAHPARGEILPTVFIPVAEKDPAVIDRLTEWAVRGAIAHHRDLDAAGLAVPIAVNVSGASLHRIDFPDRLEALLHEANATGHALQLEVTESVATADMTAMLDVLTRLRLKGIAVSIDDFGTGFSSLVALHRLPFSEIKIDRSFVSGVSHSRDSLTIVRSIADLARNLGLRSVAEGVETQADAETLREVGVDYLQGYLFSKPLLKAALVPWLRRWALQANTIN